MKKKCDTKKSLKSYRLGTSKEGTVRIYNETPAEAMAENDIVKAKAMYEAESNPWAMSLGMLGNMAVQYGSSMMGNYGGAMSGVMQGGAALSSMEMGGETDGEEVEVEGEEVFETPDGEVGEFKGPKHSQGGMDVQLPDGTKIFSEKLKVGGKSLADRKLSREKKMQSLLDKLEKNPTDKILKSTIERTEQANAAEELADFQLQEFANILDGLQTFAYGTSRKGLTRGGKRKMELGGDIGDPIFTQGMNTAQYNDYIANYIKDNPTFDINNPDDRKALQGAVGVSQDGVFGPKTFEALKTNYPMSTADSRSTAPAIQLDSLPATIPTKKGDTVAPVGELNRNATPTLATPGFNPDEEGSPSNFRMTAGDMTGMFGTAFSVIAPYLRTLKNRAGDTANINAFEDFGNDALDTNEEAQGYIKGQRENAMQRILRNRNATVNRNRGNVRSATVSAALDLTADQNVNRAMADVYDGFAKNMMSLLSEKSKLENVQDQAVMTGEQQRDLADRMDKDNFDTQVAQNLANIGTGIQKVGQDFNKAKENQDFMDILPDLSQYGLGYTYDENGKLTIEKIG